MFSLGSFPLGVIGDNNLPGSGSVGAGLVSQYVVNLCNGAYQVYTDATGKQTTAYISNPYNDIWQFFAGSGTLVIGNQYTATASIPEWGIVAGRSYIYRAVSTSNQYDPTRDATIACAQFIFEEAPAIIKSTSDGTSPCLPKNCREVVTQEKMFLTKARVRPDDVEVAVTRKKCVCDPPPDRVTIDCDGMLKALNPADTPAPVADALNGLSGMYYGALQGLGAADGETDSPISDTPPTFSIQQVCEYIKATQSEQEAQQTIKELMRCLGYECDDNSVPWWLWLIIAGAGGYVAYNLLK